MNSLTPTQNLVQDSAIWANGSEEAESAINDLLRMITPDNAAWADLRVSEEKKYIFAEFQGFAGEILLKSIVESILPRALARTWDVIMGFGGAMPWPGPKAIAKRAGRAERTIQEDLQHLEEQELMELKESVKPTKSEDEPGCHGVLCKDFTRLYHFAHEYYLWTCHPLYHINQPAHDDCRRLTEKHLIYQAMSQEPQLAAQIRLREDFHQQIVIGEHIYQKVSRFANYQRYLHPFKDMTLADIKYLKGFIAEETEKVQPTRNPIANSTAYETKKNDNLYMYSSNLDSNLDSNQTYTCNKCSCDSSDSILTYTDNNILSVSNQDTPISRNNDRLHSLILEKQIFAEKHSISKSINNCIKSGPRLMVNQESVHQITNSCNNSINRIKNNIAFETNDAYIINKATTLPLPSVTPTFQETELKSAKHVVEQKNEDLSSKIVNSKRTVTVAGETYEFEESLEDRDARLKRNEGLVELMKRVSGAANDQSTVSTLTNICRMFERSGLDLEEFMAMIEYARDRTKRIPDNQIRCRGANGKANRIPLLLKILDKTTKIGLAEMQANDQATDTAWARQKEQKQIQAKQKAEESLQRFLASISPTQEEQDPSDDDPNHPNGVLNHQTQPAEDDLKPSYPDPQEKEQQLTEPESSGQNSAEQAAEQAKIDATDTSRALAIIPQSESPAITWHEVQQQADQIWIQHINSACHEIEQTIGYRVGFRKTFCPSCGSYLVHPLITAKGKRFACLFCQPPAHWGSEEQGTSLAIQAKIPSLPDCDQYIANLLRTQGHTIELPPDLNSQTEIPQPAAEPEKCPINHSHIEKKAKAHYIQLWDDARQAIQEITSCNVFPSAGCSICGIKAKIFVGTQGHCCCNLPPEWDHDLCQQIQQITANVPSLEECIQYQYQLAHEQQMEMMEHASSGVLAQWAEAFEPCRSALLIRGDEPRISAPSFQGTYVS